MGSDPATFPRTAPPGKRHVDRAQRRIQETPECRGAVVAQRRVPTIGRDRREPPALWSQLRMSEGIDTAMQEDELTRAHSIVDQRERDARLEQGRARDDAVEPRRCRRDDTVMGTLTGHIPV